MDSNSYANYAGYLLQHVSDVLAKQADQVLQERLGIGFSQVKILMVLQSNPKVKQKQIANRLGQTEASISRQIKLLARKAMLSTATNPSSRREKVTTLTIKGERLVGEAMSIISYYHQPVFSQLSGKQREQLLEILKTLHQASCSSGRIGSCDHPLNF